MRSFSSLFLAVLSALTVSSLALAQAYVDEGLETAFIYVDQANGNDTTREPSHNRSRRSARP